MNFSFSTMEVSSVSSDNHRLHSVYIQLDLDYPFVDQFPCCNVVIPFLFYQYCILSVSLIINMSILLFLNSLITSAAFVFHPSIVLLFVFLLSLVKTGCSKLFAKPLSNRIRQVFLIRRCGFPPGDIFSYLAVSSCKYSSSFPYVFACVWLLNPNATTPSWKAYWFFHHFDHCDFSN